MVKKQLENFNLEQICNSGQCFRMEKIGENKYRVIAGERSLDIQQNGKVCLFFCSTQEFTDVWEEYFDLKRDYKHYIEAINPRDTYLINAAKLGGGIRILKQDLWEMIVSFLISQQNNIVRIRRCIENICREYGEEKITASGEHYYAFPKAEAFACLEEDDLKACNLGYRSKYVVRAAKGVVAGEIDLQAIEKMKYAKAKEELLKIFGVGVKVADCICLFGLHHLEAFPVDTHINQALEKHYKRGFPKRRYKVSA